MKTLILFLFGFLSLSFLKNDEAINTTEIFIASDSELIISGTSNINSFDCSYNLNNLNDPIRVNFKNNGGHMDFDSTLLKLQNTYFDCGHNRINKDFNQLLKTSQYPNITLELNNVKYLDNKTIADVSIVIANVKRNYQVPIELSKDKNFKAKGEMNIHLSDFNLKAPKKALGLIVVNDALTVHFDLTLKQHS
ncbi:YceI family protein [Maribacter polysaccharolyticus]|uniref:YceI family protein n=1 Tax=Maribacter polysaccharolyticus TaxID=3020831 RepID=UPI00237F9B63|nr:YceI family protein [Maribacter polysaccharolyticus]MDE3743905.1 YceI family protein [Maribacter polysaccharolyticus]